MRPLFSIVLILVLLTQASAAELPEHILQWQPNVCRVRSAVSDHTDYGSGTYLGKGMVLTAFHVIRDHYKEKQSGELSVTFEGGSTYKGKLNGYRENCDVAFILIDVPTEANVKGCLLASEDPAIGDTVWKCGYGSNGKLMWHKGNVVSKDRYRGAGRDVWFEMRPHAISGDSGGPVFNNRGELLGDLWGSDPERGLSTVVLPSTIAACLGSELRNKIVAYHVQCFGGDCYRQPNQGLFYWLRPQQGRGFLPQRPDSPITELAPGAIEAPKNLPLVPIAPPKPPEPPAYLEPIKEQIGALEGQIKALTDRPTVDPTITDQFAALNGKMVEIAEKLTPNDPIVLNPQPLKPEPVEVAEPKKKADYTGAALALMYAGLGAAGFGLPTWLILGLKAGKKVKEVRDKRKHADEAQEWQRPYRQEPYQEPVVEAPPPSHRTQIDTQFVNVESDHYQRAHERARQEIARKYPGAQEVLEAELSLTRQFAAGFERV